MACSSRPNRIQGLEVAATLGLYYSTERERLCPTQVAQGADEVYVHVVTTRVRKLYCCQAVIVRQSLEAPLSQARYWARSRSAS